MQPNLIQSFQVFVDEDLINIFLSPSCLLGSFSWTVAFLNFLQQVKIEYKKCSWSLE